MAPALADFLVEASGAARNTEMTTSYFHREQTTVRAPAQRCYELILAIRRYPHWWRGVRCDLLGRETTLRPGSRFRQTDAIGSAIVEVTGVQPWSRIDMLFTAGDLEGPFCWEFVEEGDHTSVRHAYGGVRPKSAHAREEFARRLRLHHDTMQTETFPGMRWVLENGEDLSGGDLFEAMHTLASVRRFRPDPVPDHLLRHIIAAATRAPSARNAQPWRFLAVREVSPKRRIAELYLKSWRQAQALSSGMDADADIKHRPGYERMMRAVEDLATHLDSAPVLILACLDTAELGPLADRDGNILVPLPAYASIFPAVQNLMLAARGLGLGSTLTTLHQLVESEIRPVVAIPAHVHVAALVPLGYPRQPFRPTERRPLGEVAFLDRWGAPLSPRGR